MAPRQPRSTPKAQPKSSAKAAEPQDPTTGWEPKGATAKLAYIQAYVGHAEKTGEVNFKGTRYKHVQEHELLRVVKALLGELHCAVVPDIVDQPIYDGNKVILYGAVTLIDTDLAPGSEDRAITARFPQEANDSGDKATGKALTNWFKYALQKFFGIPTEKIDENEGSDDDHNQQTVRGGPAKKITEAEGQAFRDTMTEMVKAEQTTWNRIQAYLTNAAGVDKPEDLDPQQAAELSKWLEAEAKR